MNECSSHPIKTLGGVLHSATYLDCEVDRKFGIKLFAFHPCNGIDSEPIIAIYEVQGYHHTPSMSEDVMSLNNVGMSAQHDPRMSFPSELTDELPHVGVLVLVSFEADRLGSRDWVLAQ